MGKKREFIEIEEESKRGLEKYFYGNNSLVDEVAKIVFADYKWVTERNFDTIFDSKMFEEDRRYAEEILKKFTAKPLSEIIDEMIKNQAHVIWRRRVYDGRDYGYDPHIYENDNREAKKYIAYLFFEDIVKNCAKNGICPDFCIDPIKGKINNIGEKMIELLKLLTVDDYCCIKGYLLFLDRKIKLGNSQKIHGYDYADYMEGINCLKGVLLNDNSGQNEPLNKIISDFINQYRLFIGKIGNKEDKKEENVVERLKNIYSKPILKDTNMIDFILKHTITGFLIQTEGN